MNSHASSEAPTRLADQIRACGGLDAAIASAVNDDAGAALAELLGLRAALEVAADPALEAARLRASARGLDAQAERLMAEAADLFGRAAWRRSRDDGGLADELQGRAEVAEACACETADEAFALRLRAAEAERRRGQTSALVGVVAA